MLTDVISGIVQIALIINEQVKLVKSNKSQCDRLVTRINLILPCIKGLESIPDNAKYLPILNNLSATLQNALAMINNFADQGWIEKFFKGQKSQQNFAEITDLLEKACSQLNLALNVQQIFNREHDKQDQQEDLNYLMMQQERIIKLNQQELQEIHDVQNEQQQQRQVLESIRRRDRRLEALAESLIDRITPKPTMPSEQPIIPLPAKPVISNDSASVLSSVEPPPVEVKVNSSEEASTILTQAEVYAKSRQFTQAFQLYQRAAKSGNPQAQAKIGAALLKGRGVPMNKQEAFAWLSKAAQQNHGGAQFYLGEMLEYGDGVKQDLNQALIWYQQAVDSGTEAIQEEARKKIEKIKVKLVA